MNEKTAKLLKKHARDVNQSQKKVKRDYLRLNWKERTALKKSIKEDIS